MGEIEKTLERLNKILVKAGFAKARPNPLYKNKKHWELLISLDLQFSKDGKFIEAKNGEY
jgi:hypothetical protein